MIKDFVREGHAYLKCDQCGKEIPMLTFILTEDKTDWTIDKPENDGAKIGAFYLEHVFCKEPSIQTEIDFTNTP